VQVKELTHKEFENIFRAVAVMKHKIMDAGPNLNWSMQIHWDVNKGNN
jgi:hypothetical protein